MGNSMDYIYTSAEQKILIEVEQKSIRQSVIEQYIRCLLYTSDAADE